MFQFFISYNIFMLFSMSENKLVGEIDGVINQQHFSEKGRENSSLDDALEVCYNIQVYAAVVKW